jgi:RHS repeat-associated protein
MGRPTDWDVLDLDRDPVPGDPYEVKELARKLGAFADDVATALRSVRGLGGDTVIQSWAGLSGDAYREQFGDLPGELDKLERSYRLASGALDGYWPQLETAQADADRALAQGRQARADLDAAKSQMNSADAWVKRAQDKSRQYQDDPKPGVPPPSEQDVRDAARNATAATNAHTTASTAVHDAQARLDAAKELAAQAAGVRDRAASTAEHALHEASDAGIHNKHWWEKAVDWVADHWDDIVAACKVIVAVLGIVVMIIGGPLAWLVLAAAVIVLADTVMKYLQGKASLWDVLFAALDCIPMFKGLTTAGGLLKMARELPTLLKSGEALERVATSVRKGLTLFRRGAKELSERVCASDPVDVASGEMVLAQTDVELPGALPLVLRRTHVSSYRAGSWFGTSWASTLDQHLRLDDQGVRFTTADGMLLHYPVPEAGRTVLPVVGPRWSLDWDGTVGGPMTVTAPDGDERLEFRPLPVEPSSDRAVRLALTRVTDGGGHHAYDIAYDEAGAPSDIRHSGGYHIGIETADRRIGGLRLLNHPDRPALMRFGYDAAGNLTEVVNSSGEPLRFRYDEDRRITGWTDRNGHDYGYTYDDQGRVTRPHGSGDYLTSSFAYDDADRTTTFTDSLGFRTVYRVDEAFNITAVTDPLGNTSYSTWQEGRPTSRTDPLGNTTTFTYDSAGRLLSVVRPDGTSHRAEYDAAGRPVTVVGPDGATWRHGYDDRGNRTSVTDPGGATTRYVFDTRGNPVTVTDALGGVREVRWDAAGLPAAVIDPKGARTEYERDAFGRVTVIRDPLGDVTTLGWTTEGLPAWRELPDGSREEWTYDGEGNVMTHLDAAGGLTRFTSTAFDLDSSRTGPDGVTYRFDHDTELRLTGVVNGSGRRWSYVYDAAGRLTQETDFDGRTQTYSYDAAGRLTERTNGAGQRTRYERDCHGNAVAQHTDDGSTTFAYDGAGRLTSAANRHTTVTFERDAMGRVVAERRDGLELRNDFDLLGNRTRRVTPSGHTSTWTYGSDLRPTRLESGRHALGFVHDPAGRETSRTVGDSTVVTSRWTQGDLLAARRVEGRGETWQWSYDYRGDGHPTARQDPDGRRFHYDLDAAGRVLTVAGAGTVHGAGERYSYDPEGNVVSAAWPADEERGLSVQGDRETDGGRVLRAGRVRYAYDAQGRVVTRTHHLLSGGRRSWTYTWDSEDRLTSVTTPDGSRWHYLYDPLGRRVAKENRTDDGSLLQRTDFVWDGTRLAEEQHRLPCGDGLRTVRVRTWDWSPDSYTPLTQSESRTAADPMSQDEVDARFHAIVTDLVGTPTALVDTEGEIAWQAGHSLWGAPLDPAGGEGPECPLRFPGQYHDAETGLHYNCARYYDPETARYTSPDPLGLDPAPNDVAYVANPLAWSDPLGLSPCTILYHYTTEEGLKGILDSKSLWEATGPVHARYGDGQYFTDIAPDTIKALKKADLRPQDVQAGNISRYQLVGRLFGRPTRWGLGKTTHYVAVDVTGLEIKQGRPWVFLHPDNGPLDLTDRIISHGKTPF